MTKKRILSIDGGGIKGVVPAVVLFHLETHLKRLSNNPNSRIHDYFERGKKVKIIVNDETIEDFEGECISVVLFITNKKNLRTSPKLKENRGMFCMMGSCQECVVLLDGKKVTSCNIFIKDGMEIKTGNLNEL